MNKNQLKEILNILVEEIHQFIDESYEDDIFKMLSEGFIEKAIITLEKEGYPTSANALKSVENFRSFRDGILFAKCNIIACLNISREASTNLINKVCNKINKEINKNKEKNNAK